MSSPTFAELVTERLDRIRTVTAASGYAEDFDLGDRLTALDALDALCRFAVALSDPDTDAQARQAALRFRDVAHDRITIDADPVRDAAREAGAREYAEFVARSAL